MADGVRFELTVESPPTPVFKTGALNHSTTRPYYISFHKRWSFYENRLTTTSPMPIIQISSLFGDDVHIMHEKK